MPNLETEILHYIFDTTGIIIIASSYFMIFGIIIYSIPLLNAQFYLTNRNKNESKQRLVQIREEMTDQFNKGKITDSHYELLDKKISEYIEKLESPDVPPPSI
jgi:hypothetical protein